VGLMLTAAIAFSALSAGDALAWHHGKHHGKKHHGGHHFGHHHKHHGGHFGGFYGGGFGITFPGGGVYLGRNHGGVYVPGAVELQW
jgi:hypothetical protein